MGQAASELHPYSCSPLCQRLIDSSISSLHRLLRKLKITYPLKRYITIDLQSKNLRDQIASSRSYSSSFAVYRTYVPYPNKAVFWSSLFKKSLWLTGHSSELHFIRITFYPNYILSELHFIRITFYPNYILSELHFIRIQRRGQI
jgi:hypothetical protein